MPTPSQSSNEGIGVVTIIADVLRVRTGPGTNYGIVKNVYQGEKYQSFGYKDGWYIMLVEINGFLVNMLRL